MEEEQEFKSCAEKLHFHVTQAELHARKAHDMLYSGGGPKRSIWYRMALGRAQSILMNLRMRELRWKDS